MFTKLILSLLKDCPQVVPSFIGNQGMVVTGTVIPPLKGVSVQIVSDDGARQLAETDESGHYTYVCHLSSKPFINWPVIASLLQFCVYRMCVNHCR